MPTTLSIGQPYPVAPSARIVWSDGGSILDWRAGGPPHLLISLALPTAAEIRGAHKGEVRIGVWAARPGQPACLLWQIAGIGDGDAPYEPGRLRPEQRPDLSPLAVGQRYLLVVVLISAESGTVRAIRAVSLSERVSRAWRAAVAGEQGAGDCVLEVAGK